MPDRAVERLRVPGVEYRFPRKMPPMSEEERYRKKAVEFAELAQRAAAAAEKAHMLGRQRLGLIEPSSLAGVSVILGSAH